MITLEECVSLCGLSEAEVDAIAQHEHIPEAAAAALASYLMECEHGACEVRRMIRDDLRAAMAAGDRPKAATLLVTLRQFVAAHRSELHG